MPNMSTRELKAEIHKKIDELEDVAELLDVKQSLDWFLQGTLTPEETTLLQRLRQAKQHAEAGSGIAHEEVMKEAQSWLKR